MALTKRVNSSALIVFGRRVVAIGVSLQFSTASIEIRNQAIAVQSGDLHVWPYIRY